MDINLNKPLFIKGIVLCLFLCLAAALLLVIWSADEGTWTRLLAFHPVYIPALLFLGLVRWCFDGMAFTVMVKDVSSLRLSVCRAAVIRLIATMVAGVVPLLIGTLSVHAWLLHKEGVDLRESSAMAVMRSVLPVFIFVFNIPLLFSMREEIPGRELFTVALEFITLSAAAVIVFFAVMLVRPGLVKRAVSLAAAAAARIRPAKKNSIAALRAAGLEEVDNFGAIFLRYLRERKLTMVKAAAWILAAYLADYLAAIVIMLGFGYSPDIFKALFLQFLMRPVIYAAFTPAGTGIWDLTYAALFLMFLPKSLAGISVLLWRLIICYLPSLAGGVLLFREIRRDGRFNDWLFQRGQRRPADSGVK